MQLKKRIVCVVIIAIIFVLISAIYIINNINKNYGNDAESIEKTIKSIEGYENKSIEILEIKDIHDKRVVGFLSNTEPAYIQFSKNNRGNYEYSYIERSGGPSFSAYLINIPFEKQNIMKFMIVTNENNQIAKMELTVNEQVIEQNFMVNKKSVTWINLPDTKNNEYTVAYKYFDKNGNLIDFY